ncbi:MAG: S8/S53 family peptidase [Myxococcota bacterium]
MLRSFVGFFGFCWVGLPIASATPVVEPLPAIADVCSDARLISYDPAGCAVGTAAYQSQPLFPGTTGELARYCVHERLADQAAWPVASQVEPDCAVVSPLSWEATLLDAFRTQRETLDLTTATPLARTWLALLDTSPSSPSGGPAAGFHSDHGYVLELLARDLGCPGAGANCLFRLHHELALPLFWDGTSWETELLGGVIGRQSDLARAIYDAVDAFESLRGPSDRLVLNLSLGWLPRPLYGGQIGDAPGERPSARSVIAALRHAVCRGALVFAAAGNESGGAHHRDGLMFPAAWHDRAAPSLQDCASLEGAGPAFDGSTALLHAVSGVDGADRRLSISRPLSETLLVAPAALAIAPDPAKVVTRPVTGTSVASLMAASTAALVWSFQPGWSGDQVYGHILAEGVDLNRPAEVCHPGPCQNLRRLASCGAVHGACASAGACHGMSCTTRGAYVDEAPSKTVSSLPAASFRVSAAAMAASSPIPAVCTTTELRRGPVPRTTDVVCPLQQTYSSAGEPSVGPQPIYVCPECLYWEDASGRVSIQVTIDTPTIPLENPTLVLIDPLGAQTHVALGDLDPTVAEIHPGLSYRVDDIGKPALGLESVELRGTLWLGGGEIEAVSSRLLLADP